MLHKLMSIIEMSDDCFTLFLHWLTNMLRSRSVPVNVVLGAHEAFRLFDGGINIDPAFGGTETNTMVLDTTFKEPRAHDIDSVTARSELASDV